MKSLFKKIVVGILTFEARLVLSRYHPTVVAVTGSVGKTSAKDAIYTVLSASLFVRKSEKSFNSDVGIPLTILGCPNGWNDPIQWIKNIISGLWLILWKHEYPKLLILEVGADRPGDIRKVSQWLKPDVVVLTRFGSVPVHVEYFSSREELIEEKKWLVTALKKSGTLVYNNDDEDVVKIADSMQQKKLSFGFSSDTDVKSSYDQVIYEDALPTGVSFKVEFNNGNSMPVRILGGLGKQQIYPVLAGLAVARAFDINMVSAVEAFAEHHGPRGRMRVMPGIQNSVIIDDTYNSSPVALEEALVTLKSLEIKGKKIAVLGDMLELGKYSAEAHRKIGAIVATCADILIAVGIRSEFFAEGARGAGMTDECIIRFGDSVDAAEKIVTIVGPGDVALVKGSQSTRMERVSKALMAHPEQAGELLVRQEGEWGKR
ncbi:MAG: UDP-N-acetylmuramoyl-tripeptide--D-alanyl-D-alanine ligase [Candidatus Paceibacterota bacterium]|jgi:UDP-N-acetylmuramoyl-tripeptide--D-alanyl-D-alanine ligase